MAPLQSRNARSSHQLFAFKSKCVDTVQLYDDATPEVDDGLDWICPLPPRAKRTVKIFRSNWAKCDKFYELWSPNSNQHEFYPGSFLLPSASGATLKFPDGRIGPHDWTLHPQHFSKSRPWLGFCRRQPTPDNDFSWKSVNLELVPLAVVFLPLVSHPGMGRLDPEYVKAFARRAIFLSRSVLHYEYKGETAPADKSFLESVLETRPYYPSHADFAEVVADKYWHWEDLVSEFVSVQRGLREMEAWLTMMEQWRHRSDKPWTRSLPPPDPSANRIGVWLNGSTQDDGATQSDAAWLIYACRIPVYVIHRFVQDVEYPQWRAVPDLRGNSIDWRSGFVVGTPAEKQNSASNSYFKVFRDQLLRYSTKSYPFSHVCKEQLNRCSLSRMRSLSLICDEAALKRIDYDNETGDQDPKQGNTPVTNIIRAGGIPSWSSSSAEVDRVAASTSSSSWASVGSSSDPWPSASWASSQGPSGSFTSCELNAEFRSLPKIGQPSQNLPPSSERGKGLLINDGDVKFWRPPPLEYGPQSRQVGQHKKKNKTYWMLFVEKDYHFVFPNASSVGHPETVMVMQSKHTEEFYGEDDEDDDTPVEQRTYFDRAKGRRLIFQAPLSLPLTLYYDSSIYGFPLPELSYYFLGNGKPQSFPASHWAYSNPHPAQQSKEPIGSQPSVEACRPTSLGVSGGVETNAEETSNKMDVDGPTLTQPIQLEDLSVKPQLTALLPSANNDTTITSHTQGEPLIESVDSRHSSPTLGVEADLEKPAEKMYLEEPAKKVDTEEPAEKMDLEEPAEKMDLDRPTFVQPNRPEAFCVEFQVHTATASLASLINTPQPTTFANTTQEGALIELVDTRDPSSVPCVEADIKEAGQTLQTSESVCVEKGTASDEAYQSCSGDNSEVEISRFACVSGAFQCSSALRQYLNSLCARCNIPNGIQSIHCNSLERRDSLYPDFVVIFDDLVHAAIVQKQFLQTPQDRWHFISELRAAQVIQKSLDSDFSRCFQPHPCPSLPPRPSFTTLPSPSVRHGSQRHQPYTSGSRSALTNPTIPGQRANGRRGGCRVALLNLFPGRSFKDIIRGISDYDFPGCTPQLRVFIEKKKAGYAALPGDGLDEKVDDGT